MRGLLQEFGHDFLYGSLAADIVVGKNMARYLYHCHNWRVGFNVFKQAKPGAEQFSLGFLAHLAADTVAHNYFVPYKTVASFHKTNTRHAYRGAPLRPADGPRAVAARAAASPRAARARRLPRSHPGRRVGHPVRRLEAAVPLARERAHEPPRPRLRLVLAPERNLVLEPDLVTETNGLALEAIVGLLVEGERESEAARRRRDRAQSSGSRATSASSSRIAPRAAILPRDAHEIAAETRESSAARSAASSCCRDPREARRVAASRRHPGAAGVRGSSTVNVVPALARCRA